MFSSSKQQSQAKTVSKKGASARDTAVTILTSGCHFEGKLYCRGSSRIAGKIEGQIVSEGILIVEEEAVIFANIVADEAVIQGRVRGRIEAKTRVELCSTCDFDGELVTPSLIVQEGARFSGRATMPARENLKGLDSKNDESYGSEQEKRLFEVSDSGSELNTKAARLVTDSY